jgi:hypothetical protein
VKNYAAAVLWAAGVLTAGAAAAHSASDAYLTLTAPNSAARPLLIHGQWDIALRDLDFVLGLDDDGDGRVTWGELRHHQSAIERYAFAHLQIADGSGAPCSIKPTSQLVDAHADGAYAALFFDATCAHPAQKVLLNYRLFFAIDPSHRGILVLHAGDSIATSVLSPQNSSINLGL